MDEDYTFTDHLERSVDLYAKYKYEMTLSYLKDLGLTKSHRVLNIGCGAADFNFQVLKNGYFFDGFDQDKNAIRIAQDKIGTSNIRIENCDIRQAIETFHEYKFFTCHDVLEHIENDKEALLNIVTLMKEKGTSIVITVPAFNFLFGCHDIKLGHFRRYSKKQLIELVEDNLEIIKCHYVGLLGFFAALLYSRILKQSYPSQNQNSSKFIIKLSILIEKLFGCPFGSSVILVGRLK